MSIRSLILICCCAAALAACTDNDGPQPFARKGETPSAVDTVAYILFGIEEGATAPNADAKWTRVEDGVFATSGRRETGPVVFDVTEEFTVSRRSSCVYRIETSQSYELVSADDSVAPGTVDDYEIKAVITANFAKMTGLGLSGPLGSRDFVGKGRYLCTRFTRHTRDGRLVGKTVCHGDRKGLRTSLELPQAGVSLRNTLSLMPALHYFKTNYCEKAGFETWDKPPPPPAEVPRFKDIVPPQS